LKVNFVHSNCSESPDPRGSKETKSITLSNNSAKYEQELANNFLHELPGRFGPRTTLRNAGWFLAKHRLSEILIFLEFGSLWFKGTKRLAHCNWPQGSQSKVESPISISFLLEAECAAIGNRK
jgi:hypothetical protein